MVCSNLHIVSKDLTFEIPINCMSAISTSQQNYLYTCGPYKQLSVGP